MAAAVTLSAVPWGPASAEGAGRSPAAVGFESIGGLTWTVDTRVTDSADNASKPQASFDPQSGLHLLWEEPPAWLSGSSYAYSHRDRFGDLLQAPTIVSSHTLPGWGATYAQGTAIGIDSKGDIHIAYDDGWMNVLYEKVDRNGSVLVAPKNVGAIDSSSSHMPSLAVGTDDTIHIGHEDYKFQCEDMFYAKLANDGTEIWTNRVVSADLAAHVEFGLTRAARFDGSIAFSFGSSAGTWVARMNKYGVKDMASVKIRPQNDLKIADVAVTPDGSIHAVWEDAGVLTYSRINATGAKTIDAARMTSGATVGRFPHVDAFMDNRAAITWSDNRTGVPQVRYGVVGTGADSNSDGIDDATGMPLVTDFQLTNSTAGAREPWVAVDPDDNAVVTWIDARDGNDEVYFKRSFACGVELYAEPISPDGLYFWHPNETKVLPLFLKNKGRLADSFEIRLDTTPGAATRGWVVSVNQTYFPDLAGEATALLALSIQTPANAKQGENISISINASSASSADCFDRVEMWAFVRVTRSLQVTTGTAAKIGDNGETTSFAMIATNTGDVREDGAQILVGPSMAPEGWTVVADRSSLSLDPHEAGTFTVFVTIPNETWLAPGGFMGLIGVSVRSAADASVTSTKQLTVRVKSWFFIELTPDAEVKEAPNGGTATFLITIRNVGNLGGQAQINLEAQQAGLAGWSASLSRETVFLRGGEETTFTITVPVPVNAKAGSRLTLVITAFAIKSGVSAQTEVTVTVPSICGFEAARSDGGGGFTISNGGNLEQNYTFSFAGLLPQWIAGVYQGAALVSNLTVAPHSSAEVSVEVFPPSMTPSGRYGFVWSFNSTSCGEYDHLLTHWVEPFAALDIAVDPPEVTTPAGSTVVYTIRLRNDGNSVTYVPLSTSGLPQTYRTRFVALWTDGETEFPGNLSGPLRIEPFSTGFARLYIDVPANASMPSTSFTVRAEPQGGESLIQGLRLQVVFPDAAIEGAYLLSEPPVAGVRNVLSVSVGNLGGAASGPAFLKFTLDGVLQETRILPPMSPGNKLDVWFNWTPSAGAHLLKFTLLLQGAAVERNVANNELLIEMTAVNAPATGGPIDASGLATVAIVAAGGVALFVILRTPRRARRIGK